jgi:2'-5' RNA ligase
MRRHWWLRPGWRPGRRLHAWHLTFGDQTVSRGRAELLRVAGECQARLAGLPGLDLVPAEWLHLTVQPVGFADEVDAGDAERIVAAVRRRGAALAPLRLTLGPAELQAEGVWLPVAPQAAVRRVRAAVRAGIAEVWGAARVPEAAGGFTPHVSLAYSDTDGPDEPFAAAIAAPAPPVGDGGGRSRPGDLVGSRHASLPVGDARNGTARDRCNTWNSRSACP